MKIQLRDPLDREEATKVINRIASDCETEFIYSRHAQIRQDERAINPYWIQKVLKNGNVIRIDRDETKNAPFCYKYRVRFTDKYGWTDVVTVIVTKNKLTIITVIRSD